MEIEIAQDVKQRTTRKWQFGYLMTSTPATSTRHSCTANMLGYFPNVENVLCEGGLKSHHYVVQNSPNIPICLPNFPDLQTAGTAFLLRGGDASVEVYVRHLKDDCGWRFSKLLTRTPPF